MPLAWYGMGGGWLAVAATPVMCACALATALAGRKLLSWPAALSLVLSKQVEAAGHSLSYDLLHSSYPLLMRSHGSACTYLEIFLDALTLCLSFYSVSNFVSTSQTSISYGQYSRYIHECRCGYGLDGQQGFLLHPR